MPVKIKVRTARSYALCARASRRGKTAANFPAALALAYARRAHIGATSFEVIRRITLPRDIKNRLVKRPPLARDTNDRAWRRLRKRARRGEKKTGGRGEGESRPLRGTRQTTHERMEISQKAAERLARGDSPIEPSPGTLLTPGAHARAEPQCQRN